MVFSSCLWASQGARAEGAVPRCVTAMGPWWVTALGTRQGSMRVSGTQEHVSEPGCVLELLSLGWRLCSSPYSRLGLQALSGL